MVISTSVFDSLVRNGVGVGRPGMPLRAPVDVLEVANIPAVGAILRELDEEATIKNKTPTQSQTSRELSKITAVGTSTALFMSDLGYRMLLWMRHFEAHALTPGNRLVRAGLTSGVVKEAVAAARDALLRTQASDFSVDDAGMLIFSSTTAVGGAAAQP